MATQPSVLPRYRPGQPLDYAQNRAQDPSQADPSQGAPWNPVYGSVGTPAGGETGQFATTAAGTNLPTLNTDPNQDIHNMFYNDQAIEAGMNLGVNQEATAALGYNGQRQAAADTSQDQALQQLKQTPGYTAGETAAIEGDPNAVAGVTTAGVGKEQAQLDQYGQNLGAQVGTYASYTGAGLDALNKNTQSGLNTLDTGLAGAQNNFGKLDTAVSNPALAFDPNSTEKQITDADVQQMKTSAGTRVGNEYRSAQDSLARTAAADGNSSPMAIAAARARLDAQSAAGQGDAETSADIQARQAQEQQATSIEQQREQAATTQTGFKAQAATTEQSQAQNAAALAGTTAVSAGQTAGQATIAAGESVGQAGINAANQFGTTAIGQQNTQTGQSATAAQTADQNTSTRASDVAGARIAGEGAYRTGVAQQQGLSQQGGQTAIGQQQAAASTLGSQLNSSTAARAGYETSGDSNSALNQATKVASAVLAEGGVVTEPTIATIGEKGPEMVVPMPRYRRERMAA